MFNMTPAAVQEILASAERSDAVGMALRVAARRTADGSLEFGMGFDDEREDDEAVSFETLRVLIGSPSRPLLEGAVLDFQEVQAGQAVALFLRTADGKHVVQVVVAAALGPPDAGEVANHHTHLGLHAVGLVVRAQEVDDLPVCGRQLQAFLRRQGKGECLAPVVPVEQVALAVGEHGPALHDERA